MFFKIIPDPFASHQGIHWEDILEQSWTWKNPKNNQDKAKHSQQIFKRWLSKPIILQKTKMVAKHVTGRNQIKTRQLSESFGNIFC